MASNYDVQCSTINNQFNQTNILALFLWATGNSKHTFVLFNGIHGISNHWPFLTNRLPTFKLVAVLVQQQGVHVGLLLV